MKCPICNGELQSRSYANWHVGDRKDTTYDCVSKHCSRNLSFISLVTPDQEISNYTLFFYYEGDLYRLDSSAINSLADRQRGGITSLHKFNADNPALVKSLIEIPAFMALDPNKDLTVQLREYCKRLLGLLVFS